MNHAQLRAFHAVAEAGGFTRAAERIHVTQPTLSGQVAALEARYGVKLFERRGRGIELTDLGHGLREVTRRLFGQEAEAEQLLTAAQGLTAGLLRVGADAPYQVIPLLARFNRRHPGIRLSMSFGNSERVLQELLRLHLLAEHAPGDGAQAAAQIGQLDAAPAALEQLDAITLFKSRDLAGEGRLRDVDAFGGAREAASLGDRVEGAKLCVIHRHSRYNP